MVKLQSDLVRQRVFSVDEAAHILGSSRATVYRLLRAGELKAIRIGARQRIPEGEIARITETKAI